LNSNPKIYNIVILPGHGRFQLFPGEVESQDIYLQGSKPGKIAKRGKARKY
jgi:hypothetical protein